MVAMGSPTTRNLSFASASSDAVRYPRLAHIPNINYMSDRFVTTYLCDVSEQALARCAAKVAPGPPRTTTDPEQLCASEDVDVVLIASTNAFSCSRTPCWR